MELQLKLEFSWHRDSLFQKHSGAAAALSSGTCLPILHFKKPLLERLPMPQRGTDK